jgi:hypothetical protein
MDVETGPKQFRSVKDPKRARPNHANATAKNLLWLGHRSPLAYFEI